MSTQPHRHDIPTFELGMLIWTYGNISKLVEHKLYEVDISTEQGQIEFCTRASIDIEQITALGYQAQERGRFRGYAETKLELTADLVIYPYRKQRADCLDLATPVAQGPRDEAARYTKATTWHKNSCAIDTILVLANYMQIGRVNSDIISIQRQQELHPLAYAIRQVIGTPWGLITQQERDRLRDLLTQTIQDYDPQRYRIGEYQNIQSQLDYWFHELGQLTWTEAQTETCCDQLTNIKSRGSIKRHSSVIIHIDSNHLTLDQRINKYFNHAVTEKSDQDCTNKKGCQHEVRIQKRAILEHELPPRMMIHLQPPLQYHEVDKIQPLATLELSYWANYSRIQSSYQPIGAIFILNDNHFVCRWKVKDSQTAESKFVHFDRGHFTEVGVWWQHYRKPFPRLVPRRIFQSQLDDRHQPRLVSIIFETLRHVKKARETISER